MAIFSVIHHKIFVQILIIERRHLITYETCMNTNTPNSYLYYRVVHEMRKKILSLSPTKLGFFIRTQIYGFHLCVRWPHSHIAFVSSLVLFSPIIFTHLPFFFFEKYTIVFFPLDFLVFVFYSHFRCLNKLISQHK